MRVSHKGTKVNLDNVAYYKLLGSHNQMIRFYCIGGIETVVFEFSDKEQRDKAVQEIENQMGILNL